VNIIGSRKELQPYIDKAIAAYNAEGINAFITSLHKGILKKKVRFPVLEYAATEFYKTIPATRQMAVTDSVMELKEVGRYVIAGMILQCRLEQQHSATLKKAETYIIAGDDWLACDIIGERVMGYALLTQPEKTLPVLKRLAKHDNKWIVRCIGVAAHYAIKKGLKKKYAEEMFDLLLSLSNTTDFHTKKGIGWAAKTTAKFHPDIIAKHKEYIETSAAVKQWFRTKVKIGLGRTDKYAHRYNS